MTTTNTEPLHIELSKRMCWARSNDSASSGVLQSEFQQVRDALTPEQVARIKLKQQWEGCSMLAVLRDWPELFEPLPEALQP